MHRVATRTGRHRGLRRRRLPVRCRRNAGAAGPTRRSTSRWSTRRWRPRAPRRRARDISNDRTRNIATSRGTATRPGRRRVDGGRAPRTRPRRATRRAAVADGRRRALDVGAAARRGRPARVCPLATVAAAGPVTRGRRAGAAGAVAVREVAGRAALGGAGEGDAPAGVQRVALFGARRRRGHRHGGCGVGVDAERCDRPLCTIPTDVALSPAEQSHLSRQPPAAAPGKLPDTVDAEGSLRKAAGVRRLPCRSSGWSSPRPSRAAPGSCARNRGCGRRVGCTWSRAGWTPPPARTERRWRSSVRRARGRGSFSIC